MKNIYLAFRILRKHWILHIMICIEIAFSLYIINVTFNRIDKSTTVARISAAADVQKSMMFLNSGKDRSRKSDEDSSTFETAQQKAAQSKYYISASNNTPFSIKGGGEALSGTHYDEQTAKRFVPDMTKGKWITEAKLENGHIPCVVVDTTAACSTFDIGDTIKGSAVVNTGSGRAKGRESVFEVVGILNREDAVLIMDFSGWWVNYTMPMSQLMTAYREDEIDIICGGADESIIPRAENKSGLLYFDESMPQEELEERYSEIFALGTTVKLSDMMQKENDVVIEKIKQDLPVMSSFMLTALIGIIGMSLINAKRQLHTFSVYYICGCPWKRSISIYSVYFSVIVAASFIIYMIMMYVSYISDRIGSFYMYEISVPGFLISAAICILLLLATTAAPFLNIKKYSLNDARKL